MMASIFLLGHAVHGLVRGPGCHRALVGVDVPVGQQVQLLVEHLAIQLIARQTVPASIVEDAQYRVGVLHYAYPFGLMMSDHLDPFAL